MKNIKELVKMYLDESDKYSKILCAQVIYGKDDVVYLPINGNVNKFLDKLDVEIEYETDIKEAIIWWKSGGWSEYEPTYDYHHHYWRFRKYPLIPEELQS